MSTEKDENQQLEEALEADKAAHSTAAATVDNGADKDVAPPKDAADPQSGSTTKPAKTKKTSQAKRQDTLRQAKKAQDDARNKAIAEAEAALPDEGLSQEAAEEEARREKIRAKLIENADQMAELEEGLEKLKAEARDLLAELYPHSKGSDRHVDAVRGYLKASQAERQNRGAHPARLKELLQKAGKAPIDAAMARSRARGAQRPRMSPKGVGAAPAADQAKDATPGAQE